MRYDAATEKLKCPYCGLVEELPASRNLIREIPLSEALEQIELPREAITHHRVQTCESCGAAIAYDEKHVSKRCDFCGAASVLETLLTEQPIQPQGVLPFRLTPEEAHKAFQRWLRHLWLAPSGLTRKASVQELRGIYLPLWTFDAHAYASWRAIPGYYWTYTESYYNSETGQFESRTVKEIEWGPPVQGHIERHFDDVRISGLSDFPQHYLTKIGGFSTATDLLDYDARYFLGWDVALPDKTLPQAWAEAQLHIHKKVEALCKLRIPGDTHSDFSMKLELSQCTAKLVYVPIYLLVYRYLGEPHRVLVHGRTGVVWGDRPISWWKAGLLLLTLTFLWDLYLLWQCSDVLSFLIGNVIMEVEIIRILLLLLKSILFS